MKKELIKTENYLLVVDDSEIKFREWFINPKSGYKPKRFLKRGAFEAVSPKCDKVIAHLPLNDSPILEGVPLLPPLEVEDDAKKLAYASWETIDNGNIHEELFYKKGHITGYNKAKEKYKFTEEDIQKAFTHCAKYAAECISSGVKVDFLGRLEMYLESLSQPKTPTHFEFTTFNRCWCMKPMNGGCPECTIEIITTTNSQGQKVACGKYIY